MFDGPSEKLGGEILQAPRIKGDAPEKVGEEDIDESGEEQVAVREVNVLAANGAPLEQAPAYILDLLHVTLRSPARPKVTHPHRLNPRINDVKYSNCALLVICSSVHCPSESGLQTSLVPP
ncbi:hypothetical protein DSO57_1024181 [Entomophthora muscae]|uniref:Uncharacterized protein n=1 Tax=Entomophthora muscae TaxID=34485 RepID=A0ACC2RTM0_9FUNG|nr:hypothetical protein DSO57_1024181 [Entomophthora muscae]